MTGLLFPGGAVRVRQAGRSIALLLAAVAMILPGIVLVTHAAWVALAAAHGTAIASLVTGAAWIGAGLALIALARPAPQPPAPPPGTVLPVLAMMEAFLQGLALARRDRHHP
jgi:hypothetical protein